MILSENDVNMKSNDNEDDDDDDDIDVDGDGNDKSDDDTFALDENFNIENEKEDVIRNEFSIEYMTNVVNFLMKKIPQASGNIAIGVFNVALRE